MSTAAQSPEYILGTHDAESQRLGLQHRLWSDAAHALWRRAGIMPGHRVLDVGSGPGFASFDLAQIVSAGSGRGVVVSIDESPRYIEQLKTAAAQRGMGRANLPLLGDVQKLDAALIAGATQLKELGFSPTSNGDFHGEFDLAYCRWVMCFVPDPEAVVAGVAAQLKKGGVFAVNDYFNYECMTLAPRHPSFTRVIQAVGASWRSRGGDPDIAGRLPGFFRKHGLDVTHIDVHERIARPGQTMWAWPDTFFRGYLPILVQHGFLTQAEADVWTVEWDKRCSDPDSFMFLPPVFEIVGVKR